MAKVSAPKIIEDPGAQATFSPEGPTLAGIPPITSLPCLIRTYVLIEKYSMQSSRVKYGICLAGLPNVL